MTGFRWTKEILGVNNALQDPDNALQDPDTALQDPDAGPRYRTLIQGTSARYRELVPDTGN